MSDEIIKVLDDLAKRFGIAIDWTSENVMPYLKDLFDRIQMYLIMNDATWIVIGVTMITVCILLTRMMMKKHKECVESSNNNTFFIHSELDRTVWQTDIGVSISALIFIFGVIGMFSLCCNLGDIYRDILIPEMEVLRYITNNIEV